MKKQQNVKIVVQTLSKSKIILHQGFCLLNNKNCPTCSKVYLTSEFDKHTKTHNPEKKFQKKEPNKIKVKFIQRIPTKQ